MLILEEVRQWTTVNIQLKKKEGEILTEKKKKTCHILFLCREKFRPKTFPAIQLCSELKHVVAVIVMLLKLFKMPTVFIVVVVSVVVLVVVVVLFVRHTWDFSIWIQECTWNVLNKKSKLYNVMLQKRTRVSSENLKAIWLFLCFTLAEKASKDLRCFEEGFFLSQSTRFGLSLFFSISFFFFYPFSGLS